MSSHRLGHHLRTFLGFLRLEDRVTPSGTATSSLVTSTNAGIQDSLRAIFSGPAAGASAVQLGTTTALSVLTAAPAVNSPLNLSITVRPASGTAVPGGTVTIKDGDKVLGTIGLRNGQASFSNSGLSAGVHRLSATYNGSTSLARSTSSVANVTIAAKATTPRTPPPISQPSPSSGPVQPPVVSTPGPTGTIAATCVIVVPATPVSSRQPVTLKAVVRPLGATAAIPTGRVTFRKGSLVLGSAQLDASGTATFTLQASILPPGQYYLSAYYEGNTLFAGDAGADMVVLT
jgi:hypothetical protein